MRTRFFLIVGLLAAGSVWAAPASPARALPFRATLIAPGHTPAVNSRWRYTVRVTNLRGDAVPASLRVYVYENDRRVNTIGWHGIKGSFSQTIRWPSVTRGHKLIFRVVVIATGGTTKLNYWVNPR
jgi:hypothetical protein